ncbi:MAG TPA: PaaX family transcriptional regulator C-terminal domain-containing protein [Rhizobiaceae bacterium]|nr:PaaX family transcriptional regulator C-terminal domain-containing protein [Rhizobiaceae bacterium]
MSLDPALRPLAGRLLGRSPLRAWSLIVTMFGDAALPHGGRMALSTLLAMTDRIGIDSGAVRVSAHRLVRDGTLVSGREGRQAVYGLSEAGRALFARAAGTIYSTHRMESANWRFLILAADNARAESRRTLEEAGWRQVSAGFFANANGAVAAGDLAALRFDAAPLGSAGRELAAQLWPLDALSERYRALQEALAPLTGHVPADPDDCMAMRLLLAHEYRRILLSDPRLPDDCLPQDWPGHAVARTVAQMYRQLVEPAELWLCAQPGFSDTADVARAALAVRFAV